MNACFRSFALGLAFFLPGVCNTTNAQDDAQKLGSQFIPFDGIATVLLSPSAVLSSPATQLYPHEIAEAWCLDNIGVSPKDCDSIKFITAMPGPAGPMAALVVKMNKDFSVTDLHPQLIGDGSMIEIDGRNCIPVPGSGGVVIHQLDSKTAILATQDWLDNVIAVATGNQNGALANLADKAPHSGHLTALVSIAPVRPVINGFLQSQINQIPPPFVEFTKIPDLLDAVLIRINLDDQEHGLNLTLLARDEDSAKEMQTIIADGLNLGRQIAMQQVMQNVQGDDSIQEASQAYANRMADLILERLTPQRTGRRLSLSASTSGGVAMPAVMVAMLLPAVQSARFAARRASSMNNLKQIGLAMHNYHDAYRSLPVIGQHRDEDGKPLLSWRVHVLPFIEELALYEQFKLDEPWDSEHNIKLLEKMPAVYEHKNVALAAGMTIYQAAMGDELMFKRNAPTGFRDILDGTSATIMVFESNAENAVQWTKPDDVEIDLDDPLAVMGDHGQAFNVLFGDGSVRAIPRTIAPEDLKALLTRAGGETISDF